MTSFAFFAVLMLAGCAEEPKPDLEGPYACGALTCTSGQICVTTESGSQCGVNPDAGIGPYQVYDWRCVDLPAACDGVPTCDCVPAGGAFCGGLSEDGRLLSTGCI